MPNNTVTHRHAMPYDLAQTTSPTHARHLEDRRLPRRPTHRAFARRNTPIRRRLARTRSRNQLLETAQTDTMLTRRKPHTLLPARLKANRTLVGLRTHKRQPRTAPALEHRNALGATAIRGSNRTLLHDVAAHTLVRALHALTRRRRAPRHTPAQVHPLVEIVLHHHFESPRLPCDV